MFGATYPERTSHLILFGGFARMTAAPDYPFMRSEEEWGSRVDTIVNHWGTGAFANNVFIPSLAAAPNAISGLLGKLERLTFSPGALRAMYRQNLRSDVRDLLPIVRVPTLVLHRRADGAVPVENGCYLASRIAGAQLIIYDDCGDHAIFAGNWSTLCGDVEEFVTGHRETTLPDLDRVLQRCSSPTLSILRGGQPRWAIRRGVGCSMSTIARRDGS
jgi:hypothetical protein